MRHSKVEGICSLTVLAITIVTIVGTASAQSTPKKPSIWQQVKDAAKQGAQQGQIFNTRTGEAFFVEERTKEPVKVKQ